MLKPKTKIPLSESIQNQDWWNILSSDGKSTYVTNYKSVYVEISYIEFENSDFNITLNWYIRGEKEEWDSSIEEFPKEFPIDLLKHLGLWRVDRIIKDTEMILGTKEAKQFKKALNEEEM
jgi:hypothetical protein